MSDTTPQGVFVPGRWRCVKCGFVLFQCNLNAHDGTVTARDDPGENCRNCDVPLWRVSEREARIEAERENDRMWNAGFERGQESMQKRAAEYHSNRVETLVAEEGHHDYSTNHTELPEWVETACELHEDAEQAIRALPIEKGEAT